MSEIGLYEAMASTRAVRRLRPDPIPDAVLRRVFEAATWAPSGGNRQPWRVIAVREPAIKRTFGELYQGTWAPYSSRQRAHIARLPAESRSRGERALAAGDYLAAHLHEVPVIAVFCFQPELLMISDAALPRPSVVGGASIYPAVENLLLACRAEGLGCVLTTLLCIAEERIRPLLRSPTRGRRRHLCRSATRSAGPQPRGAQAGGGDGLADRWIRAFETV
jgi:nitroreductase